MLHGGEIYNSIEIKYDFSVNINPLGIPENVLTSLRESLSLLTRYPDQECGDLRRALEQYTGIPARQILCGNGASELIEAAVRALHVRKILLTAPSFSGYRHAAESCGCEILYHTLRREEDFALTDRYMEDLVQAPDLAILCSPANPIGNRIDPDLLRRIAETCERQGTWLMVDECFLGFLPDEAQRTMRRFLVQEDSCKKTDGMKGNRSGDLANRSGDLANHSDDLANHPDEPANHPDDLANHSGDPVNQPDEPEKESGADGPVQSPKAPLRRLLVLDAFTKRFAMPGIRLGYLMAADPAVLAGIHARQPEWSVSLPAQIAGIAALETALESGSEYMEKARSLIAAERKKMTAALEKAGCRVFPGEANYIFFSSEKDLYEPLLQKGILIRRCDNYPGLQKGDYRIAVLRPEENRVLLEAIAEILADER